jgi:D-alanine transaminase
VTQHLLESWSRLRPPAGRIAYVDGRYVPHGEASVHVEDRGLQLADSVYEVLPVRDGRMLDETGHFDRLERSLGEIGMPMPMARGALRHVMSEVVRRNRVGLGIVYLQVTRGAHRRDHPIPGKQRPTLVVTARGLDPAALEKRETQGVSVISMPDIRWGRCDIKSTGLLAAVLAKTKARQAGCYEAWLIDSEGLVTEGASTNVWIVTPENVLVTRALGNNLLPGVTRLGCLRALAKEGVNAIEERPFTLAEAHAAREAFCTSSGGGVVPVIRIDGKPIGDGRPGPMVKKIQSLYRELQEREVVT